MNHHQLSKLDLGYISLFLDNDEIIDGFGESKHVSDVIAKFAKDVSGYCEYAQSKFPNDYQLYVPDFWHIAFGRAKCLTQEDGQMLWDVASFLLDVMLPMQAAGVARRISFMQFEQEEIAIEHEFGGSVFVWSMP